MMNTMNNAMNCTFCQYEWNSRVDNPKACPRCKYRLDTPWKKKHAAPQDIKEVNL